MNLPPRWTELRPHPQQRAYWESPHRFNVVPAGRRSGKTELAKRKLVMRALVGSPFPQPRYFAAAPTRDQAKRIYWDDLVALVPQAELDGVSLTELAIRLKNGSEIAVIGMDKPQRIEGSPWDGGVLDEYANMKADAWKANVRPALSDRRGWCDLIGVPEGRNHYFDTYGAALADMQQMSAASEWGAYTWTSATVLPAAEVAAAKRDLDERTYRQEYEASFESYSGIVLYAFDRAASVRQIERRSDLPLHVGMDFNVNPMTATVWQEYDGCSWQVGEVVIPTSNTDEMASEIARRYGDPRSITIYPDPAGAQHRTSALGRTDISILKDAKYQVVALTSHPLVRDRINVTNARFKAADNTRRAFVDAGCRQSIQSYERLVYKPGTSEPDKEGGFDHLVDAAGYYCWARFGANQSRVAQVPFMAR